MKIEIRITNKKSQKLAGKRSKQSLFVKLPIIKNKRKFK